jgi:hypothetical protein
MLLMIVAFAGLIVALVFFVTGRDIVIAIEETKLYTLNNAYDDTEIGMGSLWRFAGYQTLHSLEEKSAEWEWEKGITYEFVEQQISDGLANFVIENVKDQELDINRADVKLSKFTGSSKITETVEILGTQNVEIDFFEGNTKTELKTSSVIPLSLKKMIDNGNKLGEVPKQVDSGFVPIPRYAPEDSRITYLNNIETPFSPLSEFILSITDVHTKDLTLEASDDRTGLSLVYVIETTLLGEELPYFDGTFTNKQFTLPVSVEGGYKVLDCSQNEGLFTLLRPDDMLCHEGIIYTCGTDLSGSSLESGQQAGSGYACILTNFELGGSSFDTYQFCAASEIHNIPECCNAFGRTYDGQSDVCV